MSHWNKNANRNVSKNQGFNQFSVHPMMRAGIMSFGLLLTALWGFTGCSEGTVPNSPPDDIEAAKFDPDDPKNKGIGAAIPPE